MADGPLRWVRLNAGSATTEPPASCVPVLSCLPLQTFRPLSWSSLECWGRQRRSDKSRTEGHKGLGTPEGGLLPSTALLIGPEAGRHLALSSPGRWPICWWQRIWGILLTIVRTDPAAVGCLFLPFQQNGRHRLTHLLVTCELLG